MSTKLYVSQRILNMPVSPVRSMDEIANATKAKGINVLHLNIGDPDIATPYIFWQKVNKYNSEVLGYAPSQGVLELRKSISNYYKKYNLDYKEDELLITAGGSEALNIVLSTICDKGDEIIIFEPFYTNYNGFCNQVDINISSIITDSENGYRLPNKNEVEKKITKKTRAILISNPGNPTGIVLNSNEMKMIEEIALEHNLYIISDEVYRDFIYEGNYFKSFGQIDKLDEHVIIIDSVSKRFSSCGARIGNIATKNKELLFQMLKICQNRLAVSTIEQVACTSLYTNFDDIIKPISEEYRRRRDYLNKKLSQVDLFTFTIPEGAFYIMLEFNNINTADFSTWLLSEFQIDNETVMLSSASGFYKNSDYGKNKIRLAYVLSIDKLERAINIITKGIEKYKEINGIL